MDVFEHCRQYFNSQGWDLQTVANTYDSVVTEQGWPLKLPVIDFAPNTLLLLHFQDFVTTSQGQVNELETVARFYGDRAKQCIVMHWPCALQRFHHGDLNFIEFDWHEYNILNNLNQRHQEWIDVVETPKTLPWQCLNGRICDHRVRVSKVLQHWGLGILSLGDDSALPHWHYSTYFGTENEDNFIRLKDVYAQCRVNIVTETQYDHAPGIVSEKTFFALLSGQIPIVIGHPGIVDDCRHLGFDMFDDVVDNSYDYLPNDERAEQALLRNQDLIQGRIDLAPYQDRLRKQSNMMQQYPRILEQRLDDQLVRLSRNFCRSP